MDGWRAAQYRANNVPRIDAQELEAIRTESNQVKIVDVRNPGEYNNAHLTEVPNLPFDLLNQQMPEFPADETTYIHCAGGCRAMIAASILKARGYHNYVDVRGRFNAIKQTNSPIVENVCEGA